MKDVMKIALGVASGLVIAGIAWLIISAYIVKTTAEELSKISQNAVERIQKNAEASAQKQREVKAQELKIQQEIIESEQAAIELRIAKTKAWNKFYKKSPECENPPTMNIMGDCANIAIRAKRQFEEQWNASHPTPLQANNSLPPGFEPYTPPGGIKQYGNQ